MRRLISFIVALAIVGGGALIIYSEVAEAHRLYGRMMIAGGFMVVVGGVWLWADFVDRERR